MYQMEIVAQFLGCFEMRLNEMVKVKCLVSTEPGTVTFDAQRLLLSLLSVQGCDGAENIVLIYCRTTLQQHSEMFVIIPFGRWRN